MSVHAAVGQYVEGKIHSIYVHLDGTPAHTGMILEKYYPQGIAALLPHGDFHYFADDGRPSGYDFHPEDVREIFADREDFASRPVFGFRYLLEDGIWKVNHPTVLGAWVSVERAAIVWDSLR